MADAPADVVAEPRPYGVRAHNIATDSENRIHSDDVAQQFGFGGGLVPGVDLFAYATHPLVEAWGAQFLEAGRLTMRFRRPVYDGEEVTVNAVAAKDGAFTVTLAGDDGTTRSVGMAQHRDDKPVDLARFTTQPAPSTLLATGPGQLPLGPFGSVREQVDSDRHATYLAAINEPLPLYTEDDVLHPGATLRMANNLLMANVDLGPWIHTSSDCRFLGVTRVPTMLHAQGIVTECFERNGHQYVRYDALVLADGVPIALVDHTAIYRLAGASD